jgi:N utilization substance protein A
MVQTPRTEFAQALKAIATERGLDADVILETIKQAIIAAYKRDAKETEDEEEELEYDVDLNSVSGAAKIFAWPEGKPKEKKDVTPPDFGRIAAQTAKQVIHQRIREAEKDSIMDEFSGRVGTLISGMILRFDGTLLKHQKVSKLFFLEQIQNLLKNFLQEKFQKFLQVVLKYEL